MKTTEDLTERQLLWRDIFCLLAGIILMLLGAWAMVWLIWGIITLHVIGTVEGLMVLPCWLLGITLLDIATGSARDPENGCEDTKSYYAALNGAHALTKEDRK